MTLHLLTLAAITTLALACTTDAPPSTPSPSPTPTSEVTESPPTASPTPTPESTPGTPPATPYVPPVIERSWPAVEAIITAVETGDVDTFESLLVYTNVGCSGSQWVVVPPACADTTARSSPAFVAGVCGPVWQRDPHPILERFVERAGDLVAVIEGPGYEGAYWVPNESTRVDPINPGGDYHIIFAAQPGDEVVGYVAAVENGTLIGLRLGCRPPRQRPPPGPRHATRHRVARTGLHRTRTGSRIHSVSRP